MERLTYWEKVYGKHRIPHPNCDWEVLLIALAELEDKLESGQLIELPLKKQEYLYHLFKRKSMYGVVSWSKRRITWETYVANIVKHGDDGLYFLTSEEAEARLKELREEL